MIQSTSSSRTAHRQIGSGGLSTPSPDRRNRSLGTCSATGFPFICPRFLEIIWFAAVESAPCPRVPRVLVPVRDARRACWALTTNRTSRILSVPTQEELVRDLRQLAKLIAIGAPLTWNSV